MYKSVKYGCGVSRLSCGGVLGPFCASGSGTGLVSASTICCVLTRIWRSGPAWDSSIAPGKCSAFAVLSMVVGPGLELSLAVALLSLVGMSQAALNRAVRVLPSLTASGEIVKETDRNREGMVLGSISRLFDAKGCTSLLPS